MYLNQSFFEGRDGLQIKKQCLTNWFNINSSQLEYDFEKGSDGKYINKCGDGAKNVPCQPGVAGWIKGLMMAWNPKRLQKPVGKID